MFLVQIEEEINGLLLRVANADDALINFMLRNMARLGEIDKGWIR